MAATTTRSRLMKLFWDIQRKKNKTRSKSLQAAWAICSNEDITVMYLMKKLNRDRPVKERAAGQYALFAQ